MKNQTHEIFYPHIHILIILLLTVSLSACKKENKDIKDFDGNVYHAVKIGNQVWMVENLKTTRYRDGTLISFVTDDNEWLGQTATSGGAYCNYTATNIDYSITYGRLYNWYAVNDSRKICPQGWHIPTKTEWSRLITTLGGTDVAGGHLKSTGTTLWAAPNTADNSSRFTALPGGYRLHSGEYQFIGKNALWWTSTEKEDDNNSAYFLGLAHDNISSNIGFGDKRLGLSVRCIKD